jgi:hypothetical protein
MFIVAVQCFKANRHEILLRVVEQNCQRNAYIMKLIIQHLIIDESAVRHVYISIQ